MRGCTKGKRVIHEYEYSWDFGDEVLCQECGEDYCAETWQKSGWGNYEQMEFPHSIKDTEG